MQYVFVIFEYCAQGCFLPYKFTFLVSLTSLSNLLTNFTRKYAYDFPTILCRKIFNLIYLQYPVRLNIIFKKLMLLYFQMMVLYLMLNSEISMLILSSCQMIRWNPLLMLHIVPLPR